jgi:hypothetical protein
MPYRYAPIHPNAPQTPDLSKAAARVLPERAVERFASIEFWDVRQAKLTASGHPVLECWSRRAARDNARAAL